MGRCWYGPLVEFVEVPVGDDDFAARFVSDVCTDRGVRNELILGTDHRFSLSRVGRHRIVVAAADLDEVEAILIDHAPGLVGHEMFEHERHAHSVRARSLRLLVGVPLLAVAVALAIVALVLIGQRLA